jgi:hypothetical protein
MLKYIFLSIIIILSIESMQTLGVTKNGLGLDMLKLGKCFKVDADTTFDINKVNFFQSSLNCNLSCNFMGKKNIFNTKESHHSIEKTIFYKKIIF